MSSTPDPRSSLRRPLFVEGPEPLAWTTPDVLRTWDDGYRAGWLEGRPPIIDPTPDVGLRQAALDAALRSASGRSTAVETAAAAEVLLGFLTGKAVEQPGTVVLRGKDLVILMRAIEQGGLMVVVPEEDALGRRLVEARAHWEQEQAWKQRQQ